MCTVRNRNEDLCYKLDNKPIIPLSIGVIIFPCAEEKDIYDTEFDEYVRSVICKNEESLYKKVVCKVDKEYMCEFDFLDGKQHVFSFFFIESDVEKSSLFLIRASAKTKIWINFTLYSILSGKETMLVINLKKGVNTIVLESIDVTKYDYAFIRISDYLLEKKNYSFPCLFEGDMYYFEKFGRVFHSGTHLYDGQPFIFVFYPNHDVLAHDNTACFKLFDKMTKEVYYEKLFTINEKQIIELPKISFDDYDEGHYFCAEVKYVYANNHVYSESWALYTQPVENLIERTCQKALKVIDSIEYDYDRLCLKGAVEYIYDKKHSLSLKLSQAALLRGVIDMVQRGIHCDAHLFKHGTKRIYFFNPMYNAINFYRIYVPNNYSPTIKYPLIVLNATFEYNNWCNIFLNYTDEPVIAVDVSSRGVLLGSYMGEAAIKIAINDVLSRYSIDENRIYATGYSNGGGSTWSLAEAYPSFWAGIYIVSGIANCELLDNVKNMHIYNVSSQIENTYKYYKDISKKLRNHKDYHGYIGDTYAHATLLHLWFNEKVFKELLKCRRNEYPDRIIYVTQRNRHRKSYWVEIHSIEEGTLEGRIEAKVKSSSMIEIVCENLSGFSLRIPPQISDSIFEISINGKNSYKFERHAARNVHFVKNNMEYHISHHYLPILDVHKGNGLLDVFLDPLSIIIPNKSTREIDMVAQAYSEPLCSGFIPTVYVKYPINNYDELYSAIDIADRSYVIIDDGSQHEILNEIRKKANISYDMFGWTYNGKKHQSKYCVQQIVNSPWNPERNIHLISYNDKTMLRKNIFTRKLVIPTYANGRHEYLNNDALIFDENGYHGILDYACDVVDI